MSVEKIFCSIESRAFNKCKCDKALFTSCFQINMRKFAPGGLVVVAMKSVSLPLQTALE